MSEKLCLQWNDFQANANSAFGKLRSDNEFSDVTMACEDGQQLEAHKVILISASPFFHSLLKQHKHSHPLIYMRGIKPEDLHAILDFLYCGEANIFQENLDSFLALAEELKLKGLIGQPDFEKEKSQESMFATPKVRQGRLKALIQDQKKANICTDQQLSKVANKSEQNIAIPEYMDVQDMDARVKSMMEAGPNMLPHGKGHIRAKICKVCGKDGAPSAIRDHIEVHHLEGIVLACSTCEKTFRSRTSLRLHYCKNILNV